MIPIPPAIRDLASRILAVEGVRASAADAQVDVAVRVCCKLQTPLSRLAGPAGFASLSSRALALARSEVPALNVVQIQPDGSLAGFEEVQRDHDADVLEWGRLILVTQLLGLLATLIGESLTWRLVCQAWSDAAIEPLE